MIKVNLAYAKMVVAKDIQEKTGYKEGRTTYELKTDFDDIYDQVEKQMTVEHIEICFNKAMGEVDSARVNPHRELQGNQKQV